jgi:hypothetical protein
LCLKKSGTPPTDMKINSIYKRKPRWW